MPLHALDSYGNSAEAQRAVTGSGKENLDSVVKGWACSIMAAWNQMHPATAPHRLTFVPCAERVARHRVWLLQLQS